MRPRRKEASDTSLGAWVADCSTRDSRFDRADGDIVIELSAGSFLVHMEREKRNDHKGC